MTEEQWDAVHVVASVLSGVLIGAAVALTVAVFLF